MAVSDTVSNKKIVTFDKSGPASYAAGGFEVDQSAQFAFLHYLSLIQTASGGTIGAYHFVLALNTDSTGAFAQGKARVKVMRDRYSRSTFGNAQNAPSGVTVEVNAVAAGTSTGSSHTHAIDHDHPSTTSSAPTAGGDGVDAALGQPAIAAHTHAVDIANFTGSSGANTHAHDRTFEYTHGHGLTNTVTNTTRVEVAAGTNLSGYTWRCMAVGDG